MVTTIGRAVTYKCVHPALVGRTTCVGWSGGLNKDCSAWWCALKCGRPAAAVVNATDLDQPFKGPGHGVVAGLSDGGFAHDLGTMLRTAI